MVSLIAESFGNLVTLEKNLNNIDSNIKKLLQTYLNASVDSLNKIKNTYKNFLFTEKYGDLFYVLNHSKQVDDLIKNKKYQQTTYQNYIFEEFNCIVSQEKIPYFLKNEDYFITHINLRNKDGKLLNYNFFLKDNYVIFYGENNITDYYYKFPDTIKILDFKIDTDNFVYLVYEENTKRFFAKTHLGKSFSELNNPSGNFNSKECFFNIEITDVNELLHIDEQFFYFINNEYEVTRIELDKKYFFYIKDKVYIPKDGALEKYKYYIIKEEQVEILNIYNWINILGLNNFLVDGRFKLSTETLSIFNKIFSHKFDNTLNGGLNYFNAKVFGYDNSYINNTKKTKDYEVNINNDFFNISGNFMYNNYEKGKYQITFKNNNLILSKYDGDHLITKKTVKIQNIDEFYFCNLKFQYKKLEIPENFEFAFTVTSFDDYSFKQEMTLEKIYEIPNYEATINYIIENSSIKESTENKINLSFDGKNIIFNNYFDYSKQQFKYNHNEMKVKINEKINLDGITMFEFNGSYIINGKYIYFRDNGIFKYSKSNRFIFELINKDGYITNFWQKNQGKIIYFNNHEGIVKMADNRLESDYYVKIPFIKNYVVKNDKIYSNIKIEDTDELSIEIEKTDNILITNKFFGEPLFFKFHIDEKSLDGFHLFNSDNIEILEYISENTNDGFTIYLNIEKNKKYYYNINDSSYIYVNPIKAFENISKEYYFDDNGIIDLNVPKNIKSFKIKQLNGNNSDISLFLYNTLLGHTYHITLNQNEINTKFDLDLNIDRIQIEIENNKFNQFSFIEETGVSIDNGSSIIFFKNDRNEQIYISELNNEINLEKIDYSTLKIETEYNYIDNKFSETSIGNFYINRLNKNSIPIYYNNSKDHYLCNLFYSILPIKDSFYEDNFKSSGNNYKYLTNVLQDLAQSTNIEYEINKIDQITPA